MTEHPHHARDRRAAASVDYVGDAVRDDGIAGDEDFDMANLLEEDTGIPGAISISTRVTQHGPRVKYFQKLGPGQKSFSVSIEEEPVVANSLAKRVVDKMSPVVMDWVRTNRPALLEFWDDGVHWPKARLIAFLNGLQRV